MSDVFLSYAREDLERARNLAQAIESLGWSVWWDRKIPAGRTFADVIEEALHKARCVIVLWSRSSIQSEWVREEADEAKGRRKLVPARLDDVVPPLGFRAVHAAELVDWDGSATTPGFKQLIRDLGSLLGAPPRGDATVMRTTLAPNLRMAPAAVSPERPGANPWRWAPIVWGLAALLGVGGGGGMAYRISSDRAAQAEAARVAEEARVAEAARTAEAARVAEEARRRQAAAEHAAEDARRERENAARAAEDARRQTELDAAKRAAEQARKQAEERARDDAALRAAQERQAAAAKKAAEEAEQLKKELAEAQAKLRTPVPNPAAPAPQPPTVRPAPFTGSLSLSLFETARRSGIRPAELNSRAAMPVCGSWSTDLGFSGTAGSAFRVACLGLADYAIANGWNLAAQPSPSLWMGYCSSRIGKVPEQYRKEFMGICLRYR